jgi:virginiamycin B lyase
VSRGFYFASRKPAEDDIAGKSIVSAIGVPPHARKGTRMDVHRRAGWQSRRLLNAGALVAVLFSILTLASCGEHVYWSSTEPNFGTATIGRANLNGSGVDQSFITVARGRPSGVAVDGAHVYWTSNVGICNFGECPSFIGRANLDSSGVDQSLITADSASANGVGVDGAHVYWARIDHSCERDIDPSPECIHSIGRANLDGSGAEFVFIELGAVIPNGVAVDGAHVYWGTGGTIGRANLDGSGVDQSFITGASFADGVAVDGAHVYWANRAADTIGRANLDGSGVDQSFITGASSPVGVAVDGAHVYWANRAADTIDGSGVDQSFITGASFPFGVAVSRVASR